MMMMMMMMMMLVKVMIMMMFMDDNQRFHRDNSSLSLVSIKVAEVAGVVGSPKNEFSDSSNSLSPFDR